MNKYRRLLKLYKAGLRIYPKDLRKAYGAQMLITAEDMLREADTRIEVATIVGKLTVDLFFTAIKENVAQAGKTMKKHATTVSQRSKLANVVLGLQVVGIACMSFVWLSYALSTFSAVFNVSDHSLFSVYFWGWSVDFIGAITPIMIIPLAFAIVHKTTRLSGWQKVVRAYRTGLVGIVCYLFVLYITELVSAFYAAQSSAHGWTRPNFEWAIGLVFLANFYLIGLKFGKYFKKLVHGEIR